MEKKTHLQSSRIYAPTHFYSRRQIINAKIHTFFKNMDAACCRFLTEKICTYFFLSSWDELFPLLWFVYLKVGSPCSDDVIIRFYIFGIFLCLISIKMFFSWEYIRNFGKKKIGGNANRMLRKIQPTSLETCFVRTRKVKKPTFWYLTFITSKNFDF